MKNKFMGAKSRLKLEIKEITADGTFEGILSPYGNVDSGADVVEPGAYTKTLKERGNTVPLLWQHKSDTPIGNLTLEDRKDGLWCKGQLLMELPEAQKAYLCIKAKIVKGLSIGFEAVKDAIEKGIRHLKEIRLYEGSIVTFPMNEMALITSVKGEGETEEKSDFNETLTEIQLTDAGYQMRSALSSALGSMFWNGLTKEEMISLAETIIQQFSDAYMAYLPAYIDMLAEYYGSVETWAAKRHEQKAGAAISAANAEKLTSFRDALIGVADGITALVESKAGSTTSESKAAAREPEPVDDHSADEAAIAEMLGKVEAALSR